MCNGVLPAEHRVRELTRVVARVRACAAPRQARIKLQVVLVMNILLGDHLDAIKPRQQGQEKGQVSLKSPGERFTPPLGCLTKALKHPISKNLIRGGNTCNELQGAQEAL